jgi:hypothetical protein
VRTARAVAAALAAILIACPLALSACGDTLQDRPVPHNELEALLLAPYPVYWLGRSFAGLRISEAGHDPSGAYFISYGDCVAGGQSTCVPHLRVVSSPDNSFVPGGSAPHREAGLRGVRAVVSRQGRAIAVPTGGVVVSIFAGSARLASAAARTLVPINAAGEPGGTLPPRLPDTGFGSAPLPSQVPSPLRALR